MKLYNALKEYRTLTLRIIKEIHEENYDMVEKNFSNREYIIDKLNSMSFTKEAFKSISDELELVELEKELWQLINCNKNNLKTKISHINNGKYAKKSYDRNFYQKTKFFNKKV